MGTPMKPRKLQSTQRRARTRVVIVAVSYMKHFFELRGPLNDADAFLKVAKEAFFPRCAFLSDEDHEESINSNILVLHEMVASSALKPTGSNIQAALRWLVKDAYPKDHLIFYCSGCGSSSKSGERVLLPQDHDWGPRNLSYSQLGEQLYNQVPNGVAVSSFIDACFSTNMIDVCGQKNIWRETSTSTERNTPLGVKMMWQRREKKGMPAKVPWRCIDPPQGLFCPREKAYAELPAADPASYSHAMNGMLFQPYVSAPTHHQTNGGNKLFVLYEASRGNAFAAEGASDVFISKAGCTMGLFSYALCESLRAGTEDTTSTKPSASSSPAASGSGGVEGSSSAGFGPTTDNSGFQDMSWWELNERIRNFISTTAYKGQNPRLLVGDYALLDEHVAFVAPQVEDEEEEEKVDSL